MIKKIISFVGFIVSRTVVIYIVIYCISLLVVDYSTIKERLIIRGLNESMPNSFSYLIKLGEGTGEVEIDNQWLKQYVHYYENVIKYMPQLAEAQGMLGFCYYKLGNTKKAISALEKAIVLNPHFYWYYYNLGAIHYKQGNYERAAQLLEQGVSKKPEAILVVMKESVVYRRAFTSASNLQETMPSKLMTGYNDGYKMLILSLEQLTDYKKIQTFANKAITLGLGDPAFYLYYSGVAEYQLKNYGKSIYYIQQTLKFDPNDPESFLYLGLNLKEMGQTETAKLTLTKAAALKNSNNTESKKEKFYLRIF